MERLKVRFICWLLCPILVLGGCVAQLSPGLLDPRVVSPTSDAERRIVVMEEMVWYDAKPPNTGILIPEGTYELVAEDHEYWFYSAPQKIEMRKFQNGTTIDNRASPGGLFMAKSSVNLEPAGLYIDEGNNSFLRIWILGRDFIQMKGQKWTEEP